MIKFYKAVQVYKGRMFSSNGSTADILRIIRKQAKLPMSKAVEYKLNKWTYSPKIGNNMYQHLLFVYADVRTGIGFETFECEVKNPIPIHTIDPNWPETCGIYLVSAIKLTKQVY